MSDSAQQHRSEAPVQIRCAVVTVSDTRTIETDVGGQTLIELLEKSGHALAVRELIPDEPAVMKRLLSTLSDSEEVDAILMTGGTGISDRDRTFETVTELFDRTLPGYGELFRMLSYQEIGPAAMLSRATGGVLNRTVLLTMPGSPAAVRLAMEKIICPELGHLVSQAQK